MLIFFAELKGCIKQGTGQARQVKDGSVGSRYALPGSLSSGLAA